MLLAPLPCRAAGPLGEPFHCFHSIGVLVFIPFIIPWKQITSFHSNNSILFVLFLLYWWFVWLGLSSLFAEHWRPAAHNPLREKNSQPKPPNAASSAGMKPIKSIKINFISFIPLGSKAANQNQSTFLILKEKRLNWFIDFCCCCGHKSFSSFRNSSIDSIYWFTKFINKFHQFHFCFIHLNFYTLVLL